MFAEVVADIEGHLDHDLLHRLREVEERRRRDEAEQAVVLAEVERRRLFRTDGHATMWGLLRSTVGWSDTECRNRMRVARLVTDFPAAGELLYEAHASVANITEIARGYANPRCGNQIGDVIGTLLNEARRAEYDDLRRVVRHWEQLADADGSHRDRAATHEARTAQCGVWDGVGYLAAQWGQADGITNREIFDRYVDAEWRTDWDATVARYGDKACTALMPRTDAQRRADAVTRIFADAASSPPGSTDPVTVANIHIDHQTFADLLVEAGVLPERADDLFERPPFPVTDRRCATIDGEPIDPDHATRILLEQYVRFIVHNDRGIPIRWGRRRRLFTGAARQAVMSLSPRCTHPGCRVRTSRCQADHTIEHSKGGFTDPDNGGPKCLGHNLIKNKGYSVHRDRCGYWHTYRPDGSEVP